MGIAVAADGDDGVRLLPGGGSWAGYAVDTGTAAGDDVGDTGMEVPKDEADDGTESRYQHPEYVRATSWYCISSR